MTSDNAQRLMLSQGEKNEVDIISNTIVYLFQSSDGGEQITARNVLKKERGNTETGTLWWGGKDERNSVRTVRLIS